MKAYNWVKTYWPAVALGLMVLAVIDATLSSLLSCHPISANPGGGTYSKPNQEECTALNGPILVSLAWLLKGIHKYEGAFLAIFTVVLAIFTGRLWYSTEKLWGATTELVKGAEATAQRQLRAYIGFEGIQTDITAPEVRPNVRSVSQFTFHVKFKNTGLTPARDCNVWTDLIVTDANAGVPFFKQEAKNPEGGSGSLGANQDRRGRIVFFGWDEAQRIMLFQRRAFIWAKVEYIDIFGNNWETECCFEIEPKFENLISREIINGRLDYPFSQRGVGPQNRET